MSLELFPPRAVIGYVTAGNQKLPVEMSPEFYRALRALVARVGGASDNDAMQSEISDTFASRSNDDVMQFSDSMAQQSDSVIQAFSDLFAPSNQLSHSFSDIVQQANHELSFSDIVQQANHELSFSDVVQQANHELSFSDVVQSINPDFLLPETVQSPTDNSFSNETTYA